MKKLFTFLTMLVLGIGSMWGGDVTVSPSNGAYWKNGAPTSDAWAPQWKSTATASDGTTPMLVFTGETGMNTANGDIYSDQTYTLQAPSGYTIVSYSFNGTATGGDVTITPNGGSGTLISNGTSLDTPLAVSVGAESTTFALSGDGHISNLALTVKIEHYIVTYSTSTGTYTTSGNFVHEWNSTATDPQVTFAVNGGANNIASSTGYIYSGANGCTYNITAQAGYIITGYEIVGTAQTNAQTLTPASGGSATTFATSGTTTLSVSGLSGTGTSFTQSTPNKGIAISSFKIFLEKDPCTITYVISDANGVIYTSDPMAGTVGETITELPSSLQRPYCTYSVTSTTIVSGENTVPVTVTAYNPPFTVSSDFASATWYYATLRNKQLRADESHKDGSNRYQTNSTNERTDVYKWAFVGNPYQLSIINKGAGDSKVLYMGSQPVMQAATPASDSKARWIVSANNTGGFTVRSESGATMYINDAGNGGNLGYWNSASGANDGGSNWLISEVTASDKALLSTTITYAQTLVNGAGVLGYPSEAGASTLSTAITTAQGVYDDAGGDYFGAYNTLATAIETAKATISYIPRTDKYYTITSDRGSMVYDSSHDAQVDAEGKKFLWYTTSLDATNVNHLWGFIEQDGNYYMYNVGKQQFATVSTSGSYQLNDKGTWAFSDTPAYVTFDQGINNSVAAPYVRVRATIATTSTTYSMSISTSYVGPVITYDAQGDGGIPMVLAESSVEVDPDITDIMTSKVTDLTPFREALQDVIDACKAKVGTGLNQYASNETYETVLEAAEAEVDDEDATKGSLQDAKSYLETAYAALSLNMPTTGHFYRIKGATSEKYLAAGIANDKYAMSDEENATTIFYFNESNQLMNYNDGKYNAVTSSSWAWADNSTGATTVTFHDGHTNGGYGIQSSDIYLYDGGNNADRGMNVDMETGNVRYRSWYLEEVTSLPARSESYNTITLAPAGTTVDSSVPNVLVYSSPNTYTCVNLQLDDNTIPQVTGLGFTGTNVTYTRAATTRNWGTICLPYKPAEVDGIDYYELTSSSGTSLTFTKVDYADIKANTPYMFKNTTGEGICATAENKNFFFLSGEIGKAKEFADGFKLIGIQKNSSIVDGVKETEAIDESYQLIEDANAYYFKNSDSKFYPLYERFNMKALRCYLTTTNESARQSVLGFVIDDDATAINFIESEDGKTVDVVFDLNGCRHDQLQKGINIVNGKKVFK